MKNIYNLNIYIFTYIYHIFHTQLKILKTSVFIFSFSFYYKPLSIFKITILIFNSQC